MKRLLLGFLAICTFCVFTLTGAFGYVLEGSKWNPGGNSASIFSTVPVTNVSGPGTPGGATWSIMPTGILSMIGDVFHYPIFTYSSQDFFSLMPSNLDGTISTSHFPGGLMPTALWGVAAGQPAPYEALVIDWALDQWASVSGFSNLGPVADGAAGGADNSVAGYNGHGASDANGGNLGDIRVAAYQFTNDAYPTVFAHTLNEPLDASSTGGQYDNMGGDVDFSINGNIPGIDGFHWIDGPAITPNGYDFESVVLHEMGHALGMDHAGVAGEVMTLGMVPGTVLRTFSADDIAGIDAIYGPGGAPSSTPEPATILLYGLGFAGAGLYRRMRRRNKT